MTDNVLGLSSGSRICTGKLSSLAIARALPSQKEKLRPAKIFGPVLDDHRIDSDSFLLGADDEENVSVRCNIDHFHAKDSK